MAQLLAWYQISIHAPRMGSDMKVTSPSDLMQIFQSTLPGWGATRPSSSSCQSSKYFNPRSPDGERPGQAVAEKWLCGFQSTLPGWGATKPCPARMISHIFQSTLPGWGATCEGRTRRRAGRFQSTLPGWGATYLVREGTYGADKFQSTLPGWGATRCSPCPRCGGEFQSTLPGWGATQPSG